MSSIQQFQYSPYLTLSFNGGTEVITFDSWEIRDIAEVQRGYPDDIDTANGYASVNGKRQPNKWTYDVFTQYPATIEKMRRLWQLTLSGYKLAATLHRYVEYNPTTDSMAVGNKTMNAVVVFDKEYDFRKIGGGAGLLLNTIRFTVKEAAQVSYPSETDKISFERLDPCGPSFVVDGAVTNLLFPGDSYTCSPGSGATIEMVFDWGIGITKMGQLLRSTQGGTMDAVTSSNIVVASILLNGAAVALPFSMVPGDAVEIVGSVTNPAAVAQVILTGTADAVSQTDSQIGTWVNYPLADRQNSIVNETKWCEGRYGLEAATATTNYDVGAYSLQAFTGKGRITFRAIGRECFYGVSPAKSYPLANIYFRHYYSCYCWGGGLDTYELGSGGGASAYGLAPGGIALHSNSVITIEVTDAGGGQVIYSHNGTPFRTVARVYNPADVWYVDISGRYNGEVHSPVFLEQL